MGQDGHFMIYFFLNAQERWAHNIPEVSLSSRSGTFSNFYHLYSTMILYRGREEDLTL